MAEITTATALNTATNNVINPNFINLVNEYKDQIIIEVNRAVADKEFEVTVRLRKPTDMDLMFFKDILVRVQEYFINKGYDSQLIQENTMYTKFYVSWRYESIVKMWLKEQSYSPIQ